MPIFPIFSDQAFEPEKLKGLSQAYENACTALGLNSLTDDPATRAVAEKIIEFAQRGVSDVAALADMTLQAFNAKPGSLR